MNKWNIHKKVFSVRITCHFPSKKFLKHFFKTRKFYPITIKPIPVLTPNPSLHQTSATITDHLKFMTNDKFHHKNNQAHPWYQLMHFPTVPPALTSGEWHFVPTSDALSHYPVPATVPADPLLPRPVVGLKAYTIPRTLSIILSPISKIWALPWESAGCSAANDRHGGMKQPLVTSTADFCFCGRN